MVSLAPLLVFVLTAASLVFGSDAAAGKLSGHVEGTVGRPMANALQEMINRNAHQPWQGVTQSLLGIVMVLSGASGVFLELQDALNTIWQVAPRTGRGLMGMIRYRFLSFAMVVGVCSLLLVSLIITAGLAIIESWWTPDFLPGGADLWQGVNMAVSFVVITLLFALVLKILPDAKVRWRDVWVGAAVTSLLFTLGKYGLSIYLAGGVTSGYGAAGSLLVVLLWVYYAAQILLFGATFTRAWALRVGGGVEAKPRAVALTAEDRARQGIPTDADVQAASGTELPMGRMASDGWRFSSNQ